MLKTVTIFRDFFFTFENLNLENENGKKRLKFNASQRFKPPNSRFSIVFDCFLRTKACLLPLESIPFIV